MNLLAGDLGGTKTTLAIYNWDKIPKKIYSKNYRSREWNSFEEILNDFINFLPSSITFPQYGCIGVAGNVSKRSFKITNLNWEINIKKLSEISNITNLEIINDFSVLIYGVPFFDKTQYTAIQGNKNNKAPINEEIIGVIGAGTGLGMARGFYKKNNIIALPSEGGHREFPIRTYEEWKFCQWLKKDLKINRLSIERVVSGTGLGHIARWRLLQKDAENHPLQAIFKKTPYQRDPRIDLPSIVSRSAKKGDPIMSEALQLWTSAYGSVTGDFALHELCSTGLWIAGGATAKNPNAIRSKTFLDSFRNKGRFQEYLSKIPIMVLLDTDAGLFSSACRAHIIAESNGRLN